MAIIKGISSFANKDMAVTAGVSLAVLFALGSFVRSCDSDAPEGTLGEQAAAGGRARQGRPDPQVILDLRRARAAGDPGPAEARTCWCRRCRTRRTSRTSRRDGAGRCRCERPDRCRPKRLTGRNPDRSPRASCIAAM